MTPFWRAIQTLGSCAAVPVVICWAIREWRAVWDRRRG